VSGALLNGHLSGSSGGGIPPGLKMSKRVEELILIAKGIAGTQSYATIDALNGLVWPSTQCMGGPKKTVRIGKVGARIDGPAERANCFRVIPLRIGDEAMRYMSPGAPGDRTRPLDRPLQRLQQTQ